MPKPVQRPYRTPISRKALQEGSIVEQEVKAI